MASPEVDLSLQDPTPEQLERIVRLGTLLAKENGTVKRSKTKAHVFLPAWVDRPLGEEDYCATVHRIAGRVGRIGYKAYELWLRESMSLLEGETKKVIGQRSGQTGEVKLSDLENGYINLYRFAWTSRHVLDATRHYRRYRREGNNLAVVQIRQAGITRTRLVAEPAEVTDLERRREDVTRADCAVLIDQLETFGEVVQRAA
jgi:hypothetical protein